MKLIDPTVITTRLRVTLENFFQVSNQAAYLGCIHHSSSPLTGCMISRLHFVLDDLGGIIKELEPRKIETSSMSFDDGLVLAGYQEIKRGLLKSWEFIEARERAIIQQAANRIPDQAGPVND